jgi:hypothetical protein
MGGVFSKPKAPPEDPALKARIAEETAIAEKEKADKEKADAQYASKQRRGLIGSRSLFGKSGGRGYFDDTTV